MALCRYSTPCVCQTARRPSSDCGILRAEERWTEQKHKIGDLQVVWASDPPDYLPTQWDLYGLAQAIDDPKHLQEAIAIEKVETEEYPEWARAFRYLAELYVRAGDKASALEAYERVLKLQPDDKDSLDALKRLRQSIK